MNKRASAFLTMCSVSALVLAGCVHPLPRLGASGKRDSEGVRNVIILIGDGMGPQAIGLLNSYAKYAPNSIYKSSGRRTSFERVMEAGVVGYAYHEAAGVLVTDSAASATQMASGRKALSETVGIDQYGNPTETILEKAEKMGKSTGLVSDTLVTHATPACFAAHQSHRSKQALIALDLLGNDVDVMLAGGLCYWVPKKASDRNSEVRRRLDEITGGGIEIKSKRKDNMNLLEEARKRGYALAFTRDQLQNAEGDKLLGLFANGAFPYRIDLRPNEAGRTVPTLAEMAAKALDILSENEKGFFLMVESGLIDWVAHANDAGALLHEMIRFDETVAVVFEWVEGRDDTLLIVTSDHETGGFSFSYSRSNLAGPRDFPGAAFKGETFAPGFNFGGYDILDRIYKQKLSYDAMMKKFDSLPAERQTPAAMARIVNEYSEFPVTAKEAAVILEREDNDCYVKGHKYLGGKTFARIHDFKEFYVYDSFGRCNILARVVAKQQNAVWSSGTHTSTPVPLVAYGPREISERFGGMLHTTEWARYAIQAMTQGSNKASRRARPSAAKHSDANVIKPFFATESKPPSSR